MTAVYGVTQFDLDENDVKSYGAWFCDVTHGTPPWKPLYVIHSWLWPGYRSIQRAYEKLSVPTSKGWDIRLKDGYPYPSVMLTTDEEAKERAVAFRDKIRPYIEDTAGLWNAAKIDLLETYEGLKKKYGLDTYESIKRLSNIDLLELVDDYRPVNTKQWDVHMDFFVPVFYLFGLFENMCRDLLGIDHTNALFSKAMGGFDSMTMNFNREIWKLGARALELGLESTFSGVDDGEALLQELQSSEAGKQWLHEYTEFLKVFGWRCDRMLDWSTPTWLEKPSLGLPAIKMAVATKGTSSINAKRELAEKERVEAEKGLLAQVSVDQRDWFEALMKAAQVAGYWSEDHNYYCDLYAAALGRWITREIGRRFAEASVIDDPEDIYFLIFEDIYRALIPMGRVKLQERVAARKAEWEGYLALVPQMLVGDPAVMGLMAKKDPVMIAAFALPNVREELKADLYGGGSAPGMVEGVARVIMTENELGTLQPGEILVAPGTSSQWTPAFEIIKGIVTDGGGALSHAVIVAREYGIPAVTGCQQATRKIKTGDKLRVDGDLGIVFINR
ncbi:MAG TPA: PEP-utilizing enzyme [Thermoleophilia bacterium]